MNIIQSVKILNKFILSTHFKVYNAWCKMNNSKQRTLGVSLSPEK